MAYNETLEKRTTLGDMAAVVVTYDITTDDTLTGLSDAGYEDIDPEGEAGLDLVLGGVVVGQENGGYAFSYDHVNGGRIHAKYADNDAASDSTLIDVPADTDVGEVRVLLFGVR